MDNQKVAAELLKLAKELVSNTAEQVDRFEEAIKRTREFSDVAILSDDADEGSLDLEVTYQGKPLWISIDRRGIVWTSQDERRGKVVGDANNPEKAIKKLISLLERGMT